MITNGGKKFVYDKLMIATGSSAWKPDVAGINLKGVHSLRSAEDQATIKEACANATNVVVIGGSFIGSECAASLKMHFKENVNIVVVNANEVPF